MLQTTPCIRCGKPRIIGKTWKQKVSHSVVTYTLTVCPDAECQKIVDSQLQYRRAKLAEIQQKSQERRQALMREKRKKH